MGNAGLFVNWNGDNGYGLSLFIDGFLGQSGPPSYSLIGAPSLVLAHNPPAEFLLRIKFAEL